jgi:glycosyltransferase involved in cell wall biosynthesis
MQKGINLTATGKHEIQTARCLKTPEISLIISFYNGIQRLRLVLASLEVQRFKDFEVIIADDGSSEAVIRELKEIISTSPLDMIHVHHEDKGWRKNIILNKAITASHGNYLVFIDGDCLLHPFCLLEHNNHKTSGKVIAGRRVYLSEKISTLLDPEKVRRGDLWGKYQFRLLTEGLVNRTRHAENAIYIKSPAIRRIINRKDKHVLGSHFSLFKEDILAVNGFDERYLAPGAGEDTDLEVRLRETGMKITSLKHIAIQYHLYHKKLIRDQRNRELLEQTRKSGISFTPYGINKTDFR